MALAGLKAVLIVSVAVGIMGIVLPKEASVLKDSRLAPHAMEVYKFLGDTVYPHIHNKWKQQFKRSETGTEDQKDNGKEAI
jgi:hypothetical protein